MAAPLELVFLPGTHSSARIAAMRRRHHVSVPGERARHAREKGRRSLYLQKSVHRQTIFMLRHENYVLRVMGSDALRGQFRNHFNAAAASR